MRNSPRLWCRECGKTVLRADAVKSRTISGWTYRHRTCFEAMTHGPRVVQAEGEHPCP